MTPPDPSSCAFARMNYLLQASQEMSKQPSTTNLSHMYGKLLKDISKKVVEKIHPEVKRTFCLACNYPLLTDLDNVTITLKPGQRRKKKARKHKKLKKSEKEFQRWKNTVKSDKLESEESTTSTSNEHCASKIERKDRRPNRLCTSCSKCGFTRSTLQRPRFVLWVEKDECKVDEGS